MRCRILGIDRSVFSTDKDLRSFHRCKQTIVEANSSIVHRVLLNIAYRLYMDAQNLAKVEVSVLGFFPYRTLTMR